MCNNLTKCKLYNNNSENFTFIFYTNNLSIIKNLIIKST